MLLLEMLMPEPGFHAFQLPNSLHTNVHGFWLSHWGSWRKSLKKNVFYSTINREEQCQGSNTADIRWHALHYKLLLSSQRKFLFDDEDLYT